MKKALFDRRRGRKSQPAVTGGADGGDTQEIDRWDEGPGLGLTASEKGSTIKLIRRFGGVMFGVRDTPRLRIRSQQV